MLNGRIKIVELVVVFIKQFGVRRSRPATTRKMTFQDVSHRSKKCEWYAKLGTEIEMPRASIIQ